MIAQIDDVSAEELLPTQRDRQIERAIARTIERASGESDVTPASASV